MTQFVLGGLRYIASLSEFLQFSYKMESEYFKKSYAHISDAELFIFHHGNGFCVAFKDLQPFPYLSLGCYNRISQTGSLKQWRNLFSHTLGRWQVWEIKVLADLVSMKSSLPSCTWPRYCCVLK